MKSQTSTKTLNADFTIQELMKLEGIHTLGALGRTVGIPTGGNFYKQVAESSLQPRVYRAFKAAFPYYNFMHMLNTTIKERAKRGTYKVKKKMAVVKSISEAEPAPVAVAAPIKIVVLDQSVKVGVPTMALYGTFVDGYYVPSNDEAGLSAAYAEKCIELEDLRIAAEASAIHNETPIAIINMMTENAKLNLLKEMEAFVKEAITKYKEEHTADTSGRLRYLKHLYEKLDQYKL